MMDFFRTLGIVGPFQVVCVEVWMYVTVFSFFFILRQGSVKNSSGVKNNKESSKPENDAAGTEKAARAVGENIDTKEDKEKSKNRTADINYATRQSIPWFSVTVLEIIESLATSLGLLGTGTGLIFVFGKLKVGDMTNSIEVLLKGFGEAINSTIFGLIISMLAFVSVTLIKRKFDFMARGILENEK